METLQLTASILSTPVAALGASEFAARPGILCDFTGLNPDLSNVSDYMHYEETNQIWTPADGDMTRVARCPITKNELYKAGEKVVAVVFGKKGSRREVEYRNFFSTDNTSVLGKKVAGIDAMTLEEFLKMVAGKMLKCTKVERHESNMVTNREGIARIIPSYIWEA